MKKIILLLILLVFFQQNQSINAEELTQSLEDPPTQLGDPIQPPTKQG